jgi:carboxylate-amine ligase
LARYEAERAVPVDISAEALGWSTFRAARDGLDAEILDEDGCVRPLPEVARAVLSRLVMIAAELDATEALDEVERILREGGGAARQRAVHARDGMPGLLRDLAARTLA